jgi:hypothetical protein
MGAVLDKEPSKNPNRLIIGLGRRQVKQRGVGPNGEIVEDNEDLTSFGRLVRMLSSAALRGRRV